MMKKISLAQRVSRITACATAMLLLLLAPVFCHANPVPEAQCGSISLAYYELGALFYRTDDGDYTGIDKDVVEELERRTNCHFKTSIESRVRIWAQLFGNTLDMSVSGISTPEREKFAQFIPYFSTRNYVLLNKDTPPSAHTMDGFLANPALMVAVVKSFRHGLVYDEWLDKLRAQKRVHEAADFATVMRLFSVNRVNAVLALPTSFQPFLQQNKLVDTTLIKDWSPTDRVVHCLIVSRSRVNQTQFDILEKAMRAMRNDGSLDKIFERHIGDKLTKEIRYLERKP